MTSPNGKKYIGQTFNKLKTRISQHANDAKRNNSTHLFKAIKKYGIKNFKIESFHMSEQPIFGTWRKIRPELSIYL